MNERQNRDQYGQPLQQPPSDSGGTGFVYGQRREQMNEYGQGIGMQQPGPLPLPVQMTVDDMRMLRDCNKESFWKRCKFSVS